MTSEGEANPGRRLVLLVYLVLFLGACGAAFRLIYPVRAGSVGYDAAASVIYFDRLTQGRHLESFVTATPKPLLTVVYGLVYNVAHDWRPISWIVIALFGASAVLAAMLVRRIGGLSAAVFAGVAVIGSLALLEDVALSYAVVWAFVACLLAGLAISAPRPHYAWAGVALGIGALARFEVVLILGLAAVILAGAWILGQARRVPGPEPRAWLVLVGLGAIPIQFLHDWLLSGNALYAEYVPTVGSVGAPLINPVTAAVRVSEHLIAMGPLLVLAVLGAVVLVRRRQWGLLIGLGAMGPGVAAFLVFLAYRRIYISNRYFDPMDLAVLVAAAIGFGALAVPELVALGRRVSRPTARALIATLLAAAVGVLVSMPFAPLNKTVRLTIRGNLAIAEAAQETLPVLRRTLATIPAVRDLPGPVAGQPAVLLVPTLLRPQFVVDLGLPTSQVANLSASGLRTDGTNPRVGQIIVHDQRADPDSAFDFLEVGVPTRIGAIMITPLLSDPVRGIWVDRIDAIP